MGCPSEATSVPRAARARSPFLPATSTRCVQNADEWWSLAAPLHLRVDQILPDLAQGKIKSNEYARRTGRRKNSTSAQLVPTIHKTIDTFGRLVTESSSAIGGDVVAERMLGSSSVVIDGGP